VQEAKPCRKVKSNQVGMAEQMVNLWPAAISARSSVTSGSPTSGALLGLAADP
jgi:hypothetical protein